LAVAWIAKPRRQRSDGGEHRDQWDPDQRVVVLAGMARAFAQLIRGTRAYQLDSASGDAYDYDSLTMSQTVTARRRIVIVR